MISIPRFRAEITPASITFYGDYPSEHYFLWRLPLGFKQLQCQTARIMGRISQPSVKSWHKAGCIFRYLSDFLKTNIGNTSLSAATGLAPHMYDVYILLYSGHSLWGGHIIVFSFFWVFPTDKSTIKRRNTQQNNDNVKNKSLHNIKAIYLYSVINKNVSYNPY